MTEGTSMTRHGNWHPLDGNMIMADKYYSDRPDDVCPECEGEGCPECGEEEENEE